jgi:hypothetical protein
VGRRKPITEDDILLTELLLARSFGNLKQSVAREASRTFRSVGGTVKKHPYAGAGAAAGAGIILYGIFRLLKGGGSASRCVNGGRQQGSRSGITMEILSIMMPIITPYITAYVEKYIGRMFPKGRY